ncbi:MAG TPA: glutathione S-transferase [Burkholderiales bacterium]|nr:glutathione S-transferase [Burkholderiales bacterium]
MRYQLYYWPGIQGRGEFIRLAFEYAGVRYEDVARKQGDEVIQQILERPGAPFACPVLKAGKLLIGQTPNILHYLGPRLGLAPKDEPRRLWLHQVQLTIADWLTEIHDTHHPIGSGLYYEDQKKEAKRRAKDFLANRLPKYVSYFEDNLSGKFSYINLSLFQMVEGLEYAFPRAMKGIRAPRLRRNRDEVRKALAAYLGSERRIAFNQQGIFRHYAELDA